MFEIEKCNFLTKSVLISSNFIAIWGCKQIFSINVSKICCNCKQATKPRAVARFEKLYNTEAFKSEWKKIFLIPYKITLYTKLRDFQFKILNIILHTNDLLYKMGKVESSFCDYCWSDLETTCIEHSCFQCHCVQQFWNEVYDLLN